MGKIQHFSLANMEGETLVDYMSRLSARIDAASGPNTEIADVIIQLPDEMLKDKQVSGTVYLSSPSPDVQKYEMDYHTEYCTAPDSILALKGCTAKLTHWLEQNSDFEVYDVKHTFGVTESSEDIVKMTIYYSKDKLQATRR